MDQSYYFLYIGRRPSFHRSAVQNLRQASKFSRSCKLVSIERDTNLLCMVVDEQGRTVRNERDFGHAPRFNMRKVKPCEYYYLLVTLDF